jgi:AP-2 complex subunit alpha
VDTIVHLIMLAGDYVADDIWHRVVRVVTNNEDVQEHAARAVFQVRFLHIRFLLRSAHDG